MSEVNWGVAKNPAEQEEHHSLGPRSDCDCQITVWAGGALCVPPGPPFTLGEELGTASGLAAGAPYCDR